MYSTAVEGTQLSATDVSAILNWVCPACGGPLGRPTREFKCQGQCGKDWRSDWENNQSKRGATKGMNGRLRTIGSHKTRVRVRRDGDQVPFTDPGSRPRPRSSEPSGVHSAALHRAPKSCGMPA
jgi:hypothetical protein